MHKAASLFKALFFLFKYVPRHAFKLVVVFPSPRSERAQLEQEACRADQVEPAVGLAARQQDDPGGRSPAQALAMEEA